VSSKEDQRKRDEFVRLEAVARAICEASRIEILCGSDIDDRSFDWRDVEPDCNSSCVGCRNAARLVLKALDRL